MSQRLRSFRIGGLSHRWVLLTGLYRSPRRRYREDHDRVLRPRTRLLRSSRMTGLFRVVTDYRSNYRAARFETAVQPHSSRHQRTLAYTPRDYGKFERYQWVLAEERLCARAYDSEQASRRAIGWVFDCNCDPHTACADLPPASRVHELADNVMTSYT